MPAPQLQDMTEYRAPRRRPWIFLVLLIGLGIGAYFSFFQGDGDSTGRAVTPDDRTAPPPSATSEGAPSAPAKPVPADLAARLDEARILVKEEFFLEARNELLAIYKASSDPAFRALVERPLAPANIELVMTPRQMPEKEDYLVKPGNSVERIARRFGTTVDLTMLNNNLMNPNLIRSGDRFRVFSGMFALVACKSRNDLVVTMNGEFFKRYAVGMGKFGRTPTGTFVVKDRIKDPPWWRPDGREVPFGDPENILGTRWMSIRATGDTEDVRGYGIHGTWDDASIGHASSAGCVRMHNKDIEELFAYIPSGTTVTIVE